LSADGTGTATVQREVTMRQVLGGSSPQVTIMMKGSVVQWQLQYCCQPKGAGDGIPVSIWTGGSSPHGDVTMTGSSATCQAEGFTGNNAQCGAELLSDGDGTIVSSYNPTFPDVLPNDPISLMMYSGICLVWRVRLETIYTMANSTPGSCRLHWFKRDIRAKIQAVVDNRRL